MQLSQGKTHAFLVFCLINVGFRIAKTIEETGEPWGAEKSPCHCHTDPSKNPLSFPLHALSREVEITLYIYIYIYIINVCEKARQ
jgi:hypothetical protein